METIRHILRVERRDINYLRVTLESYDGMVLVRTIDPYVALIEIHISPGCENLVYGLLRNLKEQEKIKVKNPGLIGPG